MTRIATHRQVKFFTSDGAGSTDEATVPHSFSSTPDEHMIDGNVEDLFRLFACHDVGVSTSVAPGYVFPTTTVDLGTKGKHGGIEFRIVGPFTGFDLVYQSYINEGAEIEVFMMEDFDSETGVGGEWEHVGTWGHGSSDRDYYNLGVVPVNPAGLSEGINFRLLTSNMMFRSIRTSGSSTIVTYPSASAAHLPAMNFFGDSITRGSTLRVRTQSFAYQLAARLGRQPFVHGYSGGGYEHEYSSTVDVVPSLIEAALKTRPAATFVQLGLNDYRNGEAASDVGDQAFQLFRAIKSHGGALVCTGVLTPEYPNNLALAISTDTAIRRAAKAAGADLIIDTFNDGDLFVGSDSMSTIGSGYVESDTSAWAIYDDDLHMTAGGHKLMADKYFDAIVAADLPEFADIQRIKPA